MGNELNEALDSIRKQIFTDYEILIIDGGSTDSTMRIVEESIDLPIRFVQGHDAGVYDAMNKGISFATGQWLYFMGADDRLCEGILNTVESQLNNLKLDILYGDVIFTSDGNRYDGPFNLAKLLYKKNICHQSIFYRKQVFAKLGSYNLDYRIWADWDFNIRCFKHTNLNIKYIDAIICLYNNQSGVSFNCDTVFFKELPIYYINIITDLDKNLKILTTSRTFVIASAIKNILNKAGLFKLIKLFQK